jgi:threonine dehydratase
MERSWRARRVQDLGRAETIADGIAVTRPFPEPLADLLDLADDIVLVDDQALVAAMREAHRELGLVLEPAGAAGLAAVMTHRDHLSGQLIGTILSGGNVTTEQMQQWLGL